MPKALITPPAGQPVTLEQVKTHLRVETADDDTYISELMAAAIVHVEAETGRALITQTWRLYFDDWPCDGLVELAVSPVRLIAEIRVYDAAGSPSVLGAEKWRLDPVSDPARLLLLEPVNPGEVINGIEIDVETGYGDTGAEVPDTLRRAILVLVAHWYEFRGAASDAAAMASAPSGFARLIAPYRRPRL